MKELLPRPRHAARPTYLPHAVAIFTALLTLAFAAHVYRSAYVREQAHFLGLFRAAEVSLQSRLDTYVTALRAGAGFMRAHPEATASEFHCFVQEMEIFRHYPGIQGI